MKYTKDKSNKMYGYSDPNKSITSDTSKFYHSIGLYIRYHFLLDAYYIYKNSSSIYYSYKNTKDDITETGIYL